MRKIEAQVMIEPKNLSFFKEIKKIKKIFKNLFSSYYELKIIHPNKIKVFKKVFSIKNKINEIKRLKETSILDCLKVY